MRYKRIGAIGTFLIAILCLLSGLMYYFNQDTCPVGSFLCQNTTTCLAQRYWCDQEEQCPYKDDELNCYDYHGVFDWFDSVRDSEAVREFVCDATDIPPRCKYLKCRAICQRYTEIPQNLSSQTTSITLYDSSIERVPMGAFAEYSEIRILYLDNSSMRTIEKGAFLNLTKLFWLALDNNQITELLPGHFTGLTKLESLRANKNRITMADFSDFEGSKALNFINLNENQLTSETLKLPELPVLNEILLDENNFETIPDTLFARCPALKSLQLGYNRLHNLPMAVLNPLTKLNSLDLEGINLDVLEKNAFDIFTQLDFVYFKKFHYCATYAPKAKRCRPTSDGVSSLSHLLDKTLLRAAVWVISCVTCMGNVLVLWGRFTAKDENRVLTVIIRNLAVSDMLTGIYLFIIAVADRIFRDNYNQVASSWMSSWPCTLVGVLAMTSLEVSVLILSFMSLERYMLIVAPLKGHRTMTPQTASASMTIIWIIGVTLALVPVIHWRSSTRFYGVNGMCFPLHIDDPYLIGWEYSTFIFLGLNLTGLITIGYAYAGMFVSIWKTRHACSLSVGDSEFVLRFFLIVLTDTACWAPIIVLKIRALMKYPIPADLHAWVVVFILPVNSAVNPLLYTFTTPKFRERLSDGWFGKMRNYVARKSSAADSQISSTVSNKNVTLSLSNTKNCGNSSPLFKVNGEKIQSARHDHVF
ncbi:leucine-rich repeat-containing G protein-coupled receptor 3 isoform X3 [Xylocopa sonorina]|uniref:leucine-rich repeat-containing G protein-coupled receptor 3 isoform X3 n=1 Tax=Xylocopa sonorina TaxID=1818115 RepID=UPI00403AD37F